MSTSPTIESLMTEHGAEVQALKDLASSTSLQLDAEHDDLFLLASPFGDHFVFVGLFGDLSLRAQACD